MVEPKKNQEKKHVSWEEYDKGIKDLIKKIPSDKYDSIYALPRGGLLIGVMLSHNLDLPLLENIEDINEKTLVVDDISDSGNTLTALLKNKEVDVATLYERKGSNYKPLYTHKFLNHDLWLVFPWGRIF